MHNAAMEKTFGIIPARGGSKRLPGKNTRDFLGKPLLAWTIEVARESNVFERLILLTDDAEIAEIGKKYGAEVPFMEPSELAGDTTYVGDALSWALRELKSSGYEPGDFLLLEPTSVGREAKHLIEAARIMREERDFDSLVGISEIPRHFSYAKQLALRENIVARISDGAPLKQLTHRNQDIEPSYYINSAVYGFRSKNLFEGDKNLWGERTFGFLMDDAFLADIDTEDDWYLAEAKMKRKLGNANP